MARLIPIDELAKLAQATKEHEESPAKRIAKKVGVGVGAAAGATGLALLALRPELRKKVFQGIKNPKKTWQQAKDAWKRAKSGPSDSRKYWRGRRVDEEGPRPGGSRGGGSRGGGPHHERARTQTESFRQYDLHKMRTKAEVKKKWNELALRHHPDRGGDPEKMKHVNATFEAFKKSPDYEKLAMARYWAALASALVR